jgi:hypothetical protein
VAWRLHRHVAALRTRCGIVVVGAGRSSASDPARERPDQRDRGTTRGQMRNLHRPPVIVHSQRCQWPSTGEQEPCMPNPDPVPRHRHASPPPTRAAAGVDGHDQGRQGSPTRCSCWAVRLAAALRRSRPRRSPRCWRGLPPSRQAPASPGRPPPSASLSGRDRRCRPEGGRAGRARQGQRAPARRPGRMAAKVGRRLSRTGLGPPASRAAWIVAGRGAPIRRRFGCRRRGWWVRAVCRATPEMVMNGDTNTHTVNSR